MVFRLSHLAPIYDYQEADRAKNKRILGKRQGAIAGFKAFRTTAPSDHRPRVIHPNEKIC